jgi:hypothetical protein
MTFWAFLIQAFFVVLVTLTAFALSALSAFLLIGLMNWMERRGW